MAAGVLSLGVWAVAPKCPICLAAYVAASTGLGLSVTAATYLRWSLLAISGSLLFGLTVKRLARFRRVAGDEAAHPFTAMDPSEGPETRA